VDVWGLGDEEVFDDFGLEIKVFTTKAFMLVEMDGERKMSVMQLHDAAKTSVLTIFEASNKEEEKGVDEVVEKAGIELTEDALARHMEEMEKLYPKTVSEEDEKDPGVSICSEFD
jgi:hypothetical protein